jgi:hypothetical protein
MILKKISADENDLWGTSALIENSYEKLPTDTPTSNWFKNRIKFVARNKTPIISIAKYRHVGFFMHPEMYSFRYKKLTIS